ncbi:Tim44 domain-containing protein [Pseudoduganella namucuonensis]|uniref:Predicted lipid-binding transport protein, Tim44 family n=1 Tax=Pseudoduganella namucuonensis TaxID=1035707 RepID=A0A1I7KCP7_9BURK|nr:Tim44-like domain-containing protein [Pseudoduganella namucuonensis]SFU95218.1 Predicted lipid-binding transport protein, Tim44 family [Pseudoduganella namucuonensis]
MNMKKLMIGATLALMVGTMMTDALARPMGGGRSVGRQSQNVSKMAPQPAPPVAAPAPGRQAAPAATPNAPAGMPVKPPSPWKGILGGALLGLGLGALLSHFGLGGALASAIGSILTIALIAGAAFLIYRLVRSKMAPRTASPAGFGSNMGNSAGGNAWQQQPAARTPEIGSGLPPLQPASGLNLSKPGAAPAAHTPWGVPSDFDTAAFLRHAKSNYIRLQAAWDKGDTADIREFTTPEVFAEMRMQIQERNGQNDYTDVVTIDAELLGIENDGESYLASVKFYGTMKPAPDALAEPFQEVWNLAKPIHGDKGWLLAGIQQLA